MRRAAPPLVVLALASGCGDPHGFDQPLDAAPVETASCIVRGTDISLEPIVHTCSDQFPRPECIDGVVTLVTSPPHDTRLFEVELHGAIRIIEDGHLRADPFLDLTAESGGPVNGEGVSELGLLGLAFHPNYASNGTFYVFYTMDNPDKAADPQHPYLNVLQSYRVRAGDPYHADLSSATTLISIKDEYSNHNGGMIEFGNDGLLYVSTGDGGGDGTKPADYDNKAQNTQVLLGKILRIDVNRSDGTHPYAIPYDNPWGNEVWIRGLRNPWRWSFDRETMDMWIGDVGQAAYEELDYLPPYAQPGANLGWKMFEGNDCYEAPCESTAISFPVEARYHGTGWWAIIGGEVYRGKCFPDLVGTYFYTDCGYGTITAAHLLPDGSFVSEYTNAKTAFPTTLHSDSRGELYVGDTVGNIFQIVVKPAPTAP